MKFFFSGQLNNRIYFIYEIDFNIRVASNKNDQNLTDFLYKQQSADNMKTGKYLIPIKSCIQGRITHTRFSIIVYISGSFTYNWARKWEAQSWQSSRLILYVNRTRGMKHGLYCHWVRLNKITTCLRGSVWESCIVVFGRCRAFVFIRVNSDNKWQYLSTWKWFDI